MGYASVSQGAWFGVVDRRRAGAFAATGAVHILILLLLMSLWIVPQLAPPQYERVQAVAFDTPVPPAPPPIEPPPIRKVSHNAAAGGKTSAASVPTKQTEPRDRAALQRVEPVGVPLPRFELARAVPTPIGGSLTNGADLGGRPGLGTGTGPGSGKGTGGQGEGAGEVARQLTTSWAPSMDFRRLQRFYPAGALARQLPGQVVLECTVVKRDRVRDCVARAAGPVGEGFEEAAVAAERVYRVQVHDQDGARVYGERILIRAYFLPKLAAR